MLAGVHVKVSQFMGYCTNAVMSQAPQTLRNLAVTSDWDGPAVVATAQRPKNQWQVRVKCNSVGLVAHPTKSGEN
jgi:hypothetical protein